MNNKRHGQGTKTLPDGTTTSGQWAEGSLVGSKKRSVTAAATSDDVPCDTADVYRTEIVATDNHNSSTSTSTNSGSSSSSSRSSSSAGPAANSNNNTDNTTSSTAANSSSSSGRSRRKKSRTET